MSIAFMDNYARIRKQLYAPPAKPIVIAPKPEPKPVVRDIIQLNSVIIPDYKGDPKFSFAPAYMPPGGNWHEQERVRWAEQNGMEKRKSARQIIQEVAAKHNLTFNDLISQRRQRHIVQARHEAVWRMRNETLLSFPIMGRIMRRDHSTLVHSMQKFDRMIKEGKIDAPT